MIKLQIPHIFLKISFLILLSCTILLSSTKSYALLSAESDLSFVNIDEQDNLGNHYWGHTFTQKYSLLYSTKSKLVNGRLGNYDVQVGYELLSFDTKTSKNVNMSNSSTKGHLLYSGNVTIDPKEMPFKLKLYSHDLTTGTFERSDLNTAASNSFNYLSDYSSKYQLTTRLNSGVHRETGATLVAGVKNGMTNGYNEMLRHFPMILLDYRDITIKDVNNDTRLTQLAFVSLNKKENWFHYRYAIYNDNLDNSNSYNESQMQLGTVDQALQRRWIDFANWLQISSDALYINHEANKKDDFYQEISLNLFAAARRTDWNAYMYNSFLRRVETKTDPNATAQENASPNKIFTYTTTVPLYASGIINPTTTWDASVAYNENHTSDFRNFTKLNSNYTLFAFTRSPFKLTQGLAIEYASSESLQYKSDMTALTAKFEGTSTPKFSKELSLDALSTTRIYNYGYSDKNSKDFLDTELQGKAIYSINTKLKFSATQRLRTTFGTPDEIRSDITNAATTTPQYISPLSLSITPTKTFETSSSLQLDWQSTARLTSFINASEDIFTADKGDKKSKTSLKTGLTYKMPYLLLSSNAEYEQSSNEYSKYILSSKINYDPNRNISSFLNIVYSSYSDKINKNEVYSSNTGDGFYLEQGLKYTMFQSKGIGRKLLEVNELFKTGSGLVNNTVAQNFSNSTRTNELTLGLRYYPIRVLTLGFGTRYNTTTTFKDYVALYYASAALNYRLFETSLDFSHGRDAKDGHVEKKVAINMKKRF